MRVGLISDVHGNAIALDAVLAEIAAHPVDQLVCLGDVATLGPSPSEVLERLMRLGCPCVRGNHDLFLIEPELIHTYTEADVVLQSVAWCRDKLSAAELAFLGSMKDRWDFLLEEGVRLSAFHATLRTTMEAILATTPAEEVDEAFAGVDATVIACGHSHLQMMRQHRGTLIVNPGSVGMPFKEHFTGGAPVVLRHAEYATIDAHDGRIEVAMHRVPVDIEAVRRSIHASASPYKETMLKPYLD
jgi:predicted phosphodiesterase